MQYRLWTYYRADGAVLALVRAESDDPRASTWTSGLPSSSVFRTFTYDSLGRRLSSDDPDTDDPNNGDDATNSWRYLFNRVGDLAAVRDPRGCGQNFFYDLGGRLVGEQYVSCGEAQTAMAEQPHADNSVGHLTSIDYSAGTVDLDVVYHYDTHPSWATSASILPVGAGDNVLGRATGVSDRGQRAVLAYDDRGNVTWTARQMAFISDELALGSMTLTDDRPSQSETAPGSTADVEYDEAHTYVRTATFDHAGRPRSMTLPQDPDYDDVDPAPIVGGVLVYNRRGLPWNAAAFIGCEDPGIVDTIAAAETACSSGTVQHIIDGIDYLRDGLVGSITYGDDFGATRDATVSTTEYDSRRRPTRFTTIRDPDSGATSPELGAVSIVVDQQLTWDAANNLTEQLDLRDGAEWPAGHRPQTVYITHDSLYRVIGADYDYTQSNGTLSPSDDATDWRDDFATTFDHDPMRQRPAPMASAQAADRVVSLTWSWDYLANTTEWTDDAGRFYERSLGSITNGDDESSCLRPSALYLASNIGDGTALASGGGGWVEVDYGLGGNVVAMTVHSQCDDDTDAGDNCEDPGGSMSTRISTLRDECLCQVEQHYVYRWDELNRLAEARRYDRSGGSSGTWDLMVRQRYRYDGSNQRTVKQTLDQDAPTGVPAERIALYAYPGDFERRGLVRDTIHTEYGADSALGTETQYVIAGARTVWTHDTTLSGYDREHRLTIPLIDLIGTTAAVLDGRTGALTETGTYYPNGARETYMVDANTLTAPEPSGFTAKEADEEVGVAYFGERYLIGRVGRWATPDPLHVHATQGGEALNSFHYVAGNLLSRSDPLGLEAPPIDPPPPGIRRVLLGAGAPPMRIPAFEVNGLHISERQLGQTRARFQIGPNAILQVRTHVRTSVERMPVIPGRHPPLRNEIAISVHGAAAGNYHFVSIGSIGATLNGVSVRGAEGRSSSGQIQVTTDWDRPHEFLDAHPRESRYYDECSDCTAYRGHSTTSMYDSPGNDAEGWIRSQIDRGGISPSDNATVAIESRFHTYVVTQDGSPVARVDWRETVTYRLERDQGCWAGPGCWNIHRVGDPIQRVDNAVTLSRDQQQAAATEIRARDQERATRPAGR